jgi:DNA-directed RNA polymerase subunit M/transcription elongation factor TFIIS
MVKFCDECGSLLTPSTTTGELVFTCICGKMFNSTPEDSLRGEEYLEAAESKQKYDVFIKNSAFDPAGKKIHRMCPGCYAPYLTLIYIGSAETPIYTCTCLQRYTVQDLEEAEAKQKTKEESKPEPTQQV